MDGKEVFRRAVRIMVDSAEKSMKPAGVHADDIALVVPHQANIRIIKAACDRLGIGMDRAAVVLDRTGNTSSASIPLALVDALDNGRVNEGDLVLLVGFGAGMTAASAVIRWGGTSVTDRERATADCGERMTAPSPSSRAGRAASASPSPAASPPTATASPSRTARRRRPTGCSA